MFGTETPDLAEDKEEMESITKTTKKKVDENVVDEKVAIYDDSSKKLGRFEKKHNLKI